MQPKQTEVSTKQNKKKLKSKQRQKITGLTYFKIFTKPAEEKKENKNKL